MLRFITQMLLAMLLAVSFLSARGATPLKEPGPSAEVLSLQRDLKSNRDDLEAVRRDQLNYKIEKDLLEKAYSSNIQTINLMLTLVLGVFAILGYLGFKGVLSLKSDYSKELEELRSLRTKLEAEITAIAEQQNSFKAEVTNLTKTNEEQDRRLKVLEITEKAGQYFAAQNYSFALEFANAGLSIEPDNIRLLGLKVGCHGRLGEFTSAVTLANRLIELSPEDDGTVRNLAEYYLLANQVQKFDEHYLLYKTLLDEHLKGALSVYLKVIRAFIKGDIAAMKAEALPFVESSSAGAAPRLGTWQFNEFQHFAKSIPDGPAKVLVMEIVGFFNGARPQEAIEPLLKSA